MMQQICVIDFHEFLNNINTFLKRKLLNIELTVEYEKYLLDDRYELKLSRNDEGVFSFSLFNLLPGINDKTVEIFSWNACHSNSEIIIQKIQDKKNFERYRLIENLPRSIDNTIAERFIDIDFEFKKYSYDNHFKLKPYC